MQPDPYTDIGQYATIQPERIGTCIPYLGPGNPNVRWRLESKGHQYQVEGIDMSHVRLVGKGLDSSVPLDLELNGLTPFWLKD